MPKMIVVSESPLDTERLSDVLKRTDITVKVEFPTQNTFPKETRYRVLRKNGTAVFECVIRTFCSSLEVAELSQKNKKTKKSTQKANDSLEPEKKQELCNLVKKIEAKAFSEFREHKK